MLSHKYVNICQHGEWRSQSNAIQAWLKLSRTELVIRIDRNAFARTELRKSKLLRSKNGRKNCQSRLLYTPESMWHFVKREWERERKNEWKLLYHELDIYCSVFKNSKWVLLIISTIENANRARNRRSITRMMYRIGDRMGKCTVLHASSAESPIILNVLNFNEKRECMT